MSSGKNSGFGDWDKKEKGYHDVGLGLRVHQQHQGEGLAREAFTPNQRQELERQTVIYKYMMASMPVPPELIIPLSKYPPPNLPHLIHNTDQSSGRKGIELRFNGGGRGVCGDAEPWRCRRTDGKKWRCSRDVAPDQKYCERHSHKARNSSRSRKPVESSLTTSTATTTTTTTTNNPIVLNPFQLHPSSYDFPSSLRYPEWFMKEDGVPNAQVLYPQQIEQISAENRRHSEPQTSFFSLTSSPSDHTTRPPLRPFDAWSSEDVHKDKCPNTSSSMSAILPLTLSMSAGCDPYNGQNNLKDEDHDIRDSRSSKQPLNWMSNTWTNMPSGGPLAEALCLGISGTNNAWGSHSDELVSPHGHSSTSTGNTMSSKGSHASGDIGGQGFHLG